MLIKHILRPLLLTILIHALAMYGVAHFFPQRLAVEGGIGAYAIIGILIGLLNFFIKPILKLITFPFILFTMGLFLIPINGLIIFITSKLLYIVAPASIRLNVFGGFLSYLVIALIFGVLNWILGFFLKGKS
ncbi:MAG: phage holin family protein [Candidatus Kuenenia sp.]|nr:phage holin family protein [Candidatus Kuenenia hertensis]